MNAMDVWLMPAVSSTACPTGQFNPRDYQIGDTSFWHQEMALYSFVPLRSLTGQPALVLSLQGSDEALPSGFELVGRQHDEPLLFELAGQLEREVG